MKFGAAIGSSVVVAFLIITVSFILWKWFRCCREVASLDIKEDKGNPQA